MSAKPTTLPRWSELVGNYQTAGANETVPISAKQDSGWIPGEEPPAGYLNWYQRVVYDWIQWLNDSPAFVPVTAGASALNAFGNGGGAGIAATGGAAGGWGGSFQGGAGSGIGSSGTGGTPNGAGQSGQGAGTGAGVQGTGGATGPGLKGTGGTNSAPLNLVPRTLPSTLNDGDIWTTTASLFARINGVTRDIAVGIQAYAYAWQISGAPSIANSTETTVTGWVNENDADNAFNISTGIYTVPAGKGGLYYLGAGFLWGTFGAAANSIGQISIRTNNAGYQVVALNQQTYATASTAKDISCFIIVPLLAGDQVWVSAFQLTGVAVSLAGTRDSFFIAKRLSD